MKVDYIVCPVCHRQVPITTVRHIAWDHKDTAGGRCPQGGKPVRLDEAYRVAT